MPKISTYTPYQTTIKDTDVFILEDTVDNDTYGTLWSAIKSEISVAVGSEPIGTVKIWDKSNANTPALSAAYLECGGALISDGASAYDGERIENLNGDDVVLVLTWTTDAGGSFATVTAADLPALTEGDDVSGTGIAASSYISDITGTTVTITDIAASGSISSTFTNDGLFISGSTASGTGKKDAIQDHGHRVLQGDSANNALNAGYVQNRDNANDLNWTDDSVTDLTTTGGGIPRTDSSTYPSHRKYVMVKKIK